MRKARPGGAFLHCLPNQGNVSVGFRTRTEIGRIPWQEVPERLAALGRRLRGG